MKRRGWSPLIFDEVLKLVRTYLGLSGLRTMLLTLILYIPNSIVALALLQCLEWPRVARATRIESSKPMQ